MSATSQSLEGPSPLTDLVHKAIMSLGINAATIRGYYEHMRGYYEPRNEPPVQDARLRCEYKDAAKLLLLGFEFDIAEFLAYDPNSAEMENVKKVLFQEKDTSDAYKSAAKIYKSMFGLTWPIVDEFNWKELEEETKDRLGGNVENLDWCNSILSQLLETGASKVAVVAFFVSIIMTAIQVRCPVQEFPSQWSVQGNLRTFDELHVIKLSASIRKKPEWRKKLQDKAIVSKWQKEAMDQGATPSMFEFLIAELHWFANELDPTTGIEHSTVPGVFFSDALIPAAEHETLRIEANVLAAVPDNKKDWHPKSNGQVLDLVHPSLYPYVRGRTLRFLYKQDPSPFKRSLEMNPANTEAVAASILRFLEPLPPPQRFPSPAAALAAAGTGVATWASMVNADVVEHKWRSSSNYQWLPVDVKVSSNSPCSVHFLSYVNNLNPAAGALYSVMEGILARFIPLFERTLTETRRRRAGPAGARKEFLSEGEEYWDLPEPNYHGNSEAYDNWCTNRKFVRPVVGAFTPPSPPGTAQVSLGGKTIQVIIKMANVHLTPEKPKYTGGTWHVEGTDNERIVATGIYYYESEVDIKHHALTSDNVLTASLKNISDSSLKFRQAVEEPPYLQDRYDHLEKLYGMTGGMSGRHAQRRRTNQDLGAVATPKGRCICFPNGIQHRLSPFKLKDPTKPGHRKILVFFLIDPSQRIPSTSDVPPQQLEWFLQEVRHQPGTRLAALPQELFNIICEYIEAIAYTPASKERSSSPWLMTLEEAKEHRLVLMDERTDWTFRVNDELYEREYNLCEH